MKKIVLKAVLLSASYIAAYPQANDLPYAVATYESAGIYWKSADAGVCTIRYRETGNAKWKQSLDLWYDARDGEYKGSITGLQQDSKYEVELVTLSRKKQFSFRTRSDHFPIGKITLLPKGQSAKAVVITESGTPDAYHLVTVPEGSKSVLNPVPEGHTYGKKIPLYDYGIDINADYVIIRGVEIRDAGIHGIIIRRGRHDIVIENSHIRFWGRIGGPWGSGNFDGDMDSGIFAEEGTKNITIQRNLLEDPRGAANDWATGHPAGPQGISFVESAGGHVIRYNEITSTEIHGFNDGIGGSKNFSDTGNLNRDCDVYGNIIRNVWDDAIESEGGNTNIRIWGNYLEKYYTAIATASTKKGPVYIFRNVMGQSRKTFKGSGDGGKLFKPGGGDIHGRRYYLHNTALQPNGAMNVSPGPYPLYNTFSRNNIYDVPARLVPDTELVNSNDLDYDFFSGEIAGIAKEKNGFIGRSENYGLKTFAEKGYTATGPNLYIPSYKPEFYLSSTLQSGDRHFLVKNPLRDSGALLPGFNDDYKGAGPDLGAFEFGAPPLEFGRRAYLKYNEGWAPWELY